MQTFKKVILSFILLQIFSISLNANPGDTTWVTIYNARQITAYGSYDTTATLPIGVRFRKMRLHYILGRYACSGNPQYCGSWDYTTQIYAKPVGKDTVEIARVITPYASDWALTKTHDYVIEVADYASALEGQTGFRFFYSGYSWGFTITLKLELIEGVPPMDALSVKNIYEGYYAFGKTADPIESHLTPKTFSYTAPASRAFVKNSISGHGSDDNYCAEFCSHYYDLKINNANVAQTQLWRNTCGLNDVYPQTGTWVYDRANWCPGAVVWPIYHDITSLTTANTTFTTDIDMEPYSAPSQTNASAGYQFSSQMINYSAPNKTLDVSIEDIISPTKNENYYRSNPACSNPVIKIKNVGTNTITNVVFNYGIVGNTPLTYTWTGSLNFLDETMVTFPPSVSIYSNTTSTFQASVVAVNGSTGDQNLFNNVYQSQTSPVSVYPASFVVKIFTNNATDPITNFNETTYKLYDQNGNVVVSRSNLANATVYADTVYLTPGCYKLVVDDSGCDGYKFWANTVAGNGNVRFENLVIGNIFYNPNGDIGCQSVKYFVVNNITTGLTASKAIVNEIEVYPNPANDVAYIKFDLNKSQALTYKITDVTGKIVLQKSLNKIMGAYETIDITRFKGGIYFVSVELENNITITKKLIIQN